MCSAFALITGGLQAATPVLLPNVIYLALWPHSGTGGRGTLSTLFEMSTDDSKIAPKWFLS
jgi:hypothetical protein